MDISPDELKNKLLDGFLFLGNEPSADVLDKCVKICSSYDLEAEDVVDEWTAFAVSSRLPNLVPTLEGLEELTRKFLAKRCTPRKQKITAAAPKSYHTPAASATPTKVHEAANTSIDIPESQGISIDVPDYESRLDKRKVVLTHGSCKLFPTCVNPVDVSQICEPNGPPVAKYMYSTMGRILSSRLYMIESLAQSIAKANNIDALENSSQLPGEKMIYGSIMCDDDGKLNSASVALEMPHGDGGRVSDVILNLSQIKHYSLFPGQIVVARGTQLKDKFMVNELFTGSAVVKNECVKLLDDIQVIVAAGPFTPKNNLEYKPLQDLLQYVLEKKPHVLILTGPFLSDDNDRVSDNSMTESFDDFFATLIDTIMTALEETSTKVVLVASHCDVSHHLVYPTPAYDFRKKFQNLICAPDPCVLSIDGVSIGVTTVDVLLHIGKQELCWPNSLGDRMSRLSKHVINQSCFYPLYPPDENVPIDHEMLEKHGVLDFVPHIMILPSTFRHFVKNVEGCTVINPERLVKNYSAGTFCRLGISYKEKPEVSCEVIRI